MAKLVEMDERVAIFAQMDENVGPVILINKFSVGPEDFDEFLKAWPPKLRNLNSSQGLSRHNYTGVLLGAAPSSTMQFGNLPHSSRGQLIPLYCHRSSGKKSNCRHLVRTQKDINEFESVLLVLGTAEA